MIVVVVAMPMVVVIMIVPAAMIAVVIFIPTVVVFYAAAFAFPVAVIEAFAVVTRTNPARACVRRARPVAFMPAIMSAHGIPITANPDEFRSGLRWKDSNYARRGWRADPDADRDLSVCGVGSCQQKGEQNSDF